MTKVTGNACLMRAHIIIATHPYVFHRPHTDTVIHFLDVFRRRGVGGGGGGGGGGGEHNICKNII